MPIQSHDEHFANQPATVRFRLEQIQLEVKSRVPGATRSVSYNMPAFQLDRTFFYFAAFKKHIGIYPPVTHDQALIQEAGAFRGPKGNLSFPHDQPLPVTLIGRIAVALAAQYENASA